ncbi:MAG: ATP-binding protein [Parvularculaceae bacterium]
MSLLRKIAPKSLYGRTILIVVLPIFLMQTVITYIFFNRHWEEVTGNLSEGVANEIATTLQLWETAAGPLTQEMVENLARERLDIVIRFEPGGVIPEQDRGSIFSTVNNTLEAQLDKALDQPYWYSTKAYRAYVEIRVQMDDGYMVFLPRRDRVFATNGHIFIMWLVGATLLLGYVAVTFLRNQVRSILRLAEAAEDFGRGRDRPDFKPSGAREVRQAGRAFIAMRQRIKRHMTQRTDMLAGVSHDLRTPLTRMKLALALMDGDDAKEIKTDVDEMEGMVEEYLTFARNQTTDDTEPVDLHDLVREIHADTKRGGNIFLYDVPEQIVLNARRTALKRAITNLVGNGFKHAQVVQIIARVEQDSGIVAIHVDDDGPGIAPEKHAEAFKPFARLDEARNQNIAGTGLGLAVVRDIARAHGGEVRLEVAPLGGLRASLRLPG